MKKSDIPKFNVVLLNEKQWKYLKELYHMTPRELGIAKQVCSGLNNEQIAGLLKIQYSTVKTHLRNLYRKVRINNKMSLLLKFIEDANIAITINNDCESDLLTNEKL